MAWAIFTFRQAKTHAVSLSLSLSLSLSPSLSLSLCLMNGIRSGPLWLCSNLPLKISTIFPIKKINPRTSSHGCILQQNTPASKTSTHICLYIYSYLQVPVHFCVVYLQPKGPQGLCQEPPWLCQPSGVWRPFEGGNLSNRTIELKCTLVRSALSLPLCTITCLVLK